MQYGLLICKNTDNIGDDVQTYAQRRFLPRVDHYIDREHLDTFFPEKNVNEPVAVIMNAWYMYQKFNWPPSPYIYPLFISMHISKNDYFGIGTDFLEGIGKEYLQEYEPIGARDISTLQILKEKEIQAYLSGCLTLTLKLDKEKHVGDIVYLVDIDTETSEIIKKQFPNENYQVIKHEVDYTVGDISYDKRMELVEQLLEKYQDAKCVITSRLHCALPCLALETPVLMVYEDAFEDRIKTFLDLLHYVRRSELQGEKLNYNISSPVENKNEYLKIRKELENTCKEFIRLCEKNTKRYEKQETELWKSHWIEKASWQKNLLDNSELLFRKELNKQQKWIKIIEDDKYWLNGQVENYKARVRELENYIEELLKAKSWLEKQSDEHEKYISELLSTKHWLETQNDKNNEIIKEKDFIIENSISELKSENSKLKYQIGLLKNDKFIQKIIKIKKYQI